MQYTHGLHPPGRAMSCGIIVQGGRLGKCFTMIFFDIFQRREKIPVRGFMMNMQYKGFVCISLFHPVDRFIGDHICCIAMISRRISFHGNKTWFHIQALSGQDLPEIKSGGIRMQMPFTDNSGLIAVCLEDLRHRHFG